MKLFEHRTSLDERGGEGRKGKEPSSAAVESRQAMPSTNFAKVETSLAALGFFTPSSRRVRTGKVKNITFTRDVDGKKVEVSADIVPSAISGLPITADQDKYLALQELITGIMQREGKVSNPIRFRSADLIRLLQNDTNAGKHYKEIAEWLDVMTSTTIISKGAVYSAGQKRFVTDRFHVFDRSVSVGQEIEDGSIADANYVWLSSWQLNNINHKYLLPIDLESYRQLKNHIAKALVLHLQVWLFASHKVGSFEKRYEELCQILDITVHRAPSLISRQLRPSLDELVAHGYLEKWRIEKTSDLRGYKVVLFHGEKFHRDRRKRIEAKTRERGEPVIVAESRSPDDPAPPEFGRLSSQEEGKAPTAPVTEPREGASGNGQHAEGSAVENSVAPIASDTPVNEGVLKALMDRGITAETARALLVQLTPDQHVVDQLEWGEHHVRANPGKFTNPAGFYIHLIRENVTVPPDFETTRKRAERQESEKQRAMSERQNQNYESYKTAELDHYIAEHEEDYQVIQDACRAKLVAQYSGLTPSMIDSLARMDARRQIGETLALLSFEEFVRVESALSRGKYTPDRADVNATTGDDISSVEHGRRESPRGAEPAL